MEEKVIKYVQDKYDKLYKGKTIMVEEFGSTFLIRTQKDESPLILSKDILNEI